MDVLKMLKRLNRIEHLLDTVEYSPGVPIMQWYEQRDKIIKVLESAGFEVQIEAVLIGNGREDRYVVFAKGMEEGYPEEWEEDI